MRRVSASLTVVMLAASGHPVTPTTLRSWVYRGHITRGQGGYDLQEILTYIEARETRMTTYPITIERKRGGHARLMLDGRDIANTVRSVRVEMQAEPPSVVYLELLPSEIILSDEECRVLIDEETSALLRKLGWTEPKAA